MATVDGKKTGGRSKGTPNKRNARLPDVQAIAEKLNVNPFEVLLHFAGNHWAELGYPSATKNIFVKGEVVTVDTIPTDERISAASKACEYLFPKRKAVEITGKDGGDLFQSFTDFVRQTVNESER